MASTLRRLKASNQIVNTWCSRSKKHLVLLWLSVYLVLNAYVLSVEAIVTNESMPLLSNDNNNSNTENVENNDYKDSHFENGRKVMVYLFQWKFSDVAKECEEFLGPKGYAGVQLSPVTEHLLIETSEFERPWWEKYHVISYQIETLAGNEEDLREMLGVCNAAGVRVYIDVVLNHMTGGLQNESATSGELIGTAGNTFNATDLDYPGVPYTSEHFHTPCALNNYLDAYEVRNCQFNGQPDLDQSNAQVQNTIVAFLNNLIDMGVAGFRISFAKFMSPVNLKTIYNSLNDLNSEQFGFPPNSRPFIVQQVIDFGADSISKTEYIDIGLVMDYFYASALAFISTGQSPLVTLQDWGPALGFLPSLDLYAFVDMRATYDKQVEPLHFLDYKNPVKYIMANAFMLIHPFGRIKEVMSSYAYVDGDFNQGPPTQHVTETTTVETNENEAEESDLIEIIPPAFDENDQCLPESGWICEHRWPAIVGLVQMANSLCNVEDGVTNFQTNGPHQVAFCRGEKAFIAINNHMQETYKADFHTCLPPGTYCDVISGGLRETGDSCLGKSVNVNAEGNAQIEVARGTSEQGNSVGADVEFGVIVIYLGSKLS